MKTRWPLPAVFAFWSIPILLSATQHAAVGTLYWPEPLFRTAPGWTLWAFFSIAILRLTERHPPRRGEWLRAVSSHLPVAVLMALAHIGVLVVANRVGTDAAARVTFPQQYFSFLANMLHVDLLIYAAIVAVAHTTEMIRANAARDAQMRAQLAEANLRALRMQLNPHFLFNSLNAAVALVRTGENRKAANVLTGLGDLLRQALNADAQLIPLGEELRFAGQYLELERIRFGERLTVAVDVAPDLLGLHVPSMILQPLVENAVVHGIAPSSEPGHIEITASSTRDRLVLHVSDNGIGMRADATASGSGVGLGNTRARLAALFGDDACLTVTSPSPGRTVATIEIPLFGTTTQGNGTGLL